MGSIDVTELLDDPDLVDPLTLIHRAVRVSSKGKTELKEQCNPTHGVIVPASGKVIARLPEAFRVAGVMNFFIKGVIVSDGLEKYPDIIKWKGKRYQVQVVFDYSNWGAGWSEGTCVKEKAST